MSKKLILDKIQYDEDRGAILYHGVRYLLIRPETIAGFQRAIGESFGLQAEEKLFEGGFSGGLLSTKKYKMIYKLSNNEIIDFMMSMGSQIGWGNFTLEEYEPEKKRLRISVSHSPFAEAYGESGHGVCHLIRGVLAGMATVLFGEECTAEEALCRAKGDTKCLFLLKVRR